jgi:transposase
MRVEVLEGAERRRRWSSDEKMRIVAETLQPGAKVTTVARRNKVASSLVFTWLRLARTGQLDIAQEPAFVPMQIASPIAPGSVSASGAISRRAVLGTTRWTD